MIRRAFLAVAVVALTAACGERVSNANLAAARTRSDSAIYSILLDSLRGSADSVLVGRKFAEFPGSAAAVPALAGWVHKQLPALDSALVVGLAQARDSGSVQAILGQAHGVRWFTEPDEPADAGPFRKYRVVSFTRVAYDSSRTRAIVYASMGCGVLCGNGSFYAFELRDGAWRKLGQVVRVIS